MFWPWKMIPSRITQMPRMTAAIRATRSCSCSDACPPLTTLTQKSCESAAAPDKVSPATTARMVANATAQMKPKKAAPPTALASSGAAMLDSIWVARFPVEGLHNLVQKVPPVVAKPAVEGAVYILNLLSAAGTGILLAAIVSGFLIGYGPLGLIKMYSRTLYLVRYSLLTIACMLGLGFVTRYSGTDATMGLAFAKTGAFYPFFGALIGWLGVALT